MVPETENNFITKQSVSSVVDKISFLEHRGRLPLLKTNSKSSYRERKAASFSKGFLNSNRHAPATTLGKNSSEKNSLKT